MDIQNIKRVKKTGKIGESYINIFVHQQLEWIYRSVPQESDFGIDGYIDIIKNEFVTGQTIGIQIKCGDSYYNKRTEGGIRYDGENKHLNFYINWGRHRIRNINPVKDFASCAKA